MKQLELLIDRVGDWNPQLFRELKERLTLRNLSLAAIASLLVQGLIWLSFSNQIPFPKYDWQKKLIEESSRYCAPLSGSNRTSFSYISEKCQLDLTGLGYQINWQIWWQDLYTSLTLVMAIGLILGAVYTLVADLSKEEKRGTLNFIRLSPQTPESIFSGKLLGVPSLVYFGALLALPYRLIAGLAGGVNLALFATVEIAIISIWLFWSCASILYCLLGGKQAILTTLVVSYFGFSPVMLINYFTTGTVNNEGWLKDSTNGFSGWFWLPIFSHGIYFNLFLALCFGVCTQVIWAAISRRYLNPTATVMSKIQGYSGAATLQVMLLGFAIPAVISSNNQSERSSVIWAMIATNFLFLTLLIPALLPSKQAMQDWSRYRRDSSKTKHNLIRDLLFHEQSPALLAISLILTLVSILWSGILLLPTEKQSLATLTRSLGCLSLACSLILIYAAIVHTVQFYKLKRRQVWMVGAVSAGVALPIAISFALTGGNTPNGLAAFILLFHR
jgi:hypothetical protein